MEEANKATVYQNYLPDLPMVVKLDSYRTHYS